MNRADRGPLLLIVAGVLLLLSVVTFLINDVEHNSLRRAADIRDRQAVLKQVQRVTVELNTLREGGVAQPGEG